MAGKMSKDGRVLDVTVMSFGYKQGPPPMANMVFDVRFLKNPYWVDELRPLSGLDKAVQDYVLEQPLAIEFLDSVFSLLETVLPKLDEVRASHFVIAFGCTGGQHRSTALIEALAKGLSKRFANCRVKTVHRELNLPKHDEGEGPKLAESEVGERR